ncbi:MULTISPECIES: MerR family transcriptional regulator [unclassified Halanaerobium]|uniref:MerR family transcriptional regulator n=1 Tax=unclassified Halanaerobium TaxID=2641197 RepID=UPI000DF28202|nr:MULTISPECIES: MerR family transcriptional regulator [unclassified Halanaerobium]RCW50736.1 DNA-binding transcriptional MerR regulator [Halanaerobium sp. MA284_MarDTE_T2]RCW80176.1 DNA-binding transcriptional MerR regulator [Halanaerobium sp. DL-01]
MQISEVSERFDLTKDTLRYYERVGLIPEIRRNSSGNRDYTEEDCNWIEFIKYMRDAGLSIDTLIEYLKLYQKGDSTIKERKELLTEERDKLAEKINKMQQTLERLNYKIDVYEEKIVKREKELITRKKELETI